VHKLVGGDFTPGVDDGATTWTFSVKGKQMVLAYRPGESHATLNGATYNNIAALQSAAKTIAMNAGAGASITEMRGYTASILRQQAMLLEEPF
jgi:hypothetical protein